MKVASLQYRFPVLKPALQAAAQQFRNRDAVMQTGIGKGLKFNTGGSIAGYAVGNSEPDLQAALELLAQDGMVVYDIGANVGFVSVLLARLVGPTGQVFAFEPVPANAQQIQYNARANQFSNIRVQTVAIAESDGVAGFRLTDFSTTGKFAAISPTTGHTEILVPTRQIDRMVFESEIPAPSLIKIDAEGAEVGILKGAARVLAKARPILLIELHATNHEVMDILEAQGYSGHVLGRPESPREAGWNCRMVGAPRELDGFSAHIPRLTDPALLG